MVRANEGVWREAPPGARTARDGPISEIRRGGLTFNGIGAIGAVVARFVHTEEVTGSNPVSPTNEIAGQRHFLEFLTCACKIRALGPDGGSSLNSEPGANSVHRNNS